MENVRYFKLLVYICGAMKLYWMYVEIAIMIPEVWTAATRVTIAI